LSLRSVAQIQKASGMEKRLHSMIDGEYYTSLGRIDHTLHYGTVTVVKSMT
jgi:hypothetical protein